MTEAPNAVVGGIDERLLLVQVDQMRRRMFQLIDTVLASGSEIAPDIADALQRAAYELGLCLNADRLAGAAGEELLRTNTRFTGEAGRPFAMEYAREMVGALHALYGEVLGV